MSELRYIVYKHTAPNNKVYIGITSKSVKERWRNGKGYLSNPRFYNAIVKYGWNNIKHEILFENIEQEDAFKKEKELISFYKSSEREFGYNVSTGGYHGSLGVKQSEETKQLKSKKMKGRFVGVYLGGKSPKARKVNQYDFDGNFIKTWGSTTEIQRFYKIDYSCIVRCCTRRYKQSIGYIWLYEEDKDIESAVKRVHEKKTLSEKHKQNISKGVKRHFEELKE